MFCPNCGTNNEQGMNFCKNCGNPLNHQNIDSNTNNINNSMNNNINSYNNMTPNMSNTNMNNFNNMNQNNNHLPNINNNVNPNNFNNANQVEKEKKKRNGIISIVIGAISILLAFKLSFFVIPLAIVGIVIGAKAKKSGIVGIILNIISILITLAILIIAVFIVARFNYIGTYECGSYNSLMTKETVDYDIEFQLNVNNTFIMKYDDENMINGKYKMEEIRNEKDYIIYDLVLDTTDRTIEGKSLSQTYTTKYSLGIRTDGDVELLNTVTYSRYACRRK